MQQLHSFSIYIGIFFENRIAPAPIKPIPVTTCAAIREGSSVISGVPKMSENPNADTIIIRQEPTQTSMCVRKPAAQCFRSRSNPISAPKNDANESRIMISETLIILRK